MKTLKCLILILSISIMAISCQKEELTPLVEPMTINELIDNKPIKFNFSATQTEIEEFAGDLTKFPLFGRIFQGLALILADITIFTKKGHAINIDPLEIDLSILEGVDLSLLEWINFDSITIYIDRAKKEHNLKFLKSLEVYAYIPADYDGVVRDNDGMVKLISFNEKRDGLQCDGTCLSMKIEPQNWKDLIQKNNKLYIKPVILINSVPKSSMKLAVDVDFSVKMDFSF